MYARAPRLDPLLSSVAYWTHLQYPRRDELMAHVTPILHNYSSLRPEQGVYCAPAFPSPFRSIATDHTRTTDHDDGRAERLLSLTGVIPVSLRGTTYHCPLVLYLPLDYPAKPPIVQVLPTATMQVKASAHVDAKTNRVVVPYMTDWGRKGEVSSLASLGGLWIRRIGWREI